MVIWVIGMSAAGKTTIGQGMVRLLRASMPERRWIFLDGDSFRNIMGDDLGHTVPDRRVNAERLSRICAFLNDQGVDVLACVLSIFHESQDWNRANMTDYKQLFIKVDKDILKQRDNKNLYSRAEKGEIDNVVGVQIPFPEPKNSDYVLDNNASGASMTELALKALKGLGIEIKCAYPYVRDDLLKNPTKYQYTKYEGSGFLESYRSSREEALIKLKKSIEDYFKSVTFKPEETDPAISGETEFILNKIKGKLSVDRQIIKNALARELSPANYRESFLRGVHTGGNLITREYFLEELQKLTNGSWDYVSRKEKLLSLIQRFEVTKKIFNYYKAEKMKCQGNGHDDLLNFPFFLFLLTTIYNKVPQEASLVIENSILKMGDILISCMSHLTTPGQMLLTYSALQNELDIFKEISNV